MNGAALLAVWIPGKVEPEHRTRHDNGVTHRDKRNDLWRATLDLHISRAWRGRERLTGGLEVLINAYFRPPKCRAGRGMELHTVKPDADNLAKPPMDALRRCSVYRDDCIVSQPIPRKWEIPSLPGGEPCGEIGMSIVIRRAKSWDELGGDPLWAASTSPEIPRRARA